MTSAQIDIFRLLLSGYSKQESKCLILRLFSSYSSFIGSRFNSLLTTKIYKICFQTSAGLLHSLLYRRYPDLLLLHPGRLSLIQPGCFGCTKKKVQQEVETKYLCWRPDSDASPRLSSSDSQAWILESSKKVCDCLLSKLAKPFL